MTAVIWSTAPKIHYKDGEIVEIASYIVASVFNNGYTRALYIM